MARQVRNRKIDTPTARAKLKRRREPYWTVLSAGKALGYRKGKKGGYWIARYRDDAGKKHYKRLGAADDRQDENGVRVLAYADAQEKAREWFSQIAQALLEDEGPQGPYKVKDAIADYLQWCNKHRKAARIYQYAADAHILPALGDLDLSKLTSRRLANWHERLAETPGRLRTKKGEKPKFRKNGTDAETQRRRRATANRILVILRAAFNRAYAEGRVAKKDAWARVRPFKNVDAARARHLDDDEITRLVNASAEPFRSLVIGAALTGARYGELRALRVNDFDVKAGAIHIRQSKSGKPRPVFLTDEGRAFFEQVTAGKSSADLIFTKANGTPWGPSEQARPMRAACAAAKINPAPGFHVLRHSYASRAVMAGVPLLVVAGQLGHKDTRMVERHYGHLTSSYVAETVRAAFGSIGIVQLDNVAPLKGRRKKAANVTPIRARKKKAVGTRDRKA